MRRGIRQWVEATDDWRIDVVEVVAGREERVLITLDVHVRGKGSGVSVTQRLYTVVALRDGSIISIDDRLEQDEALEVAGINP